MLTITTQAVDEKLDLLALHHHHPERYPFLLESMSTGPQGQYDILFAFPGDTLSLNSNDDFLNAFDAAWSAERDMVSAEIDLPFLGGWFLYLGYELVAQIETGLHLPAPTMSMPTAFATRCPCAVIYDHAAHKTWFVAEENFVGNIKRMQQDVLAMSPLTTVSTMCDIHLQDDDGSDYCLAIERILEYIKAGDVFQVNLSRQWDADIDAQLSNALLYERLRKSNPGPFNGLITGEWGAVISSSPERLISVKGDTIETRPIAGTRPRSDKDQADKDLSMELLQHPKERAEHIMLLDLERNDLGRVCQPGSIEVNEMMVLETYAHVHHIVSNVRGRLRQEIKPVDVIRAVFPGGTITGCPKVRCMEIIAELEQTGRGAYTGSMGYVNHNGDMDLNILIRTLSRQHDKLSLRAGAGIVADSIAQQELAETHSKAKALLLALSDTAWDFSDE